jgi:hypothetical protein
MQALQSERVSRTSCWLEPFGIPQALELICGNSLITPACSRRLSMLNGHSWDLPFGGSWPLGGRKLPKEATKSRARTDITPIDAAPLPVAFTNEAPPDDAEGGPELPSQMNLPNEPPLRRHLLQPAQLAIL